MARRMAQLHNIPVDSDEDAVKKLRAAGIDPFQRKDILGQIDLGAAPNAGGGDFENTLPATQANAPRPPQTGSATGPGPTGHAAILEERAGEIRKMQMEIARRRRRNLFLMGARLMFFVLLPTIIAGFYFYRIATPMYETVSRFVVQQAAPPSAAGAGSLLSGTPLAGQQDSINVQSYLLSKEAMTRLNDDLNFDAAFSSDDIDSLQRLAPDATIEETYKLYLKRVKVSYDPTEGLIVLKVSAPSPDLALKFNEALNRYAEEKVNEITEDLRDDQMRDALLYYDEAEAAREDALLQLITLQAEVQVIDPIAESASLMGRIGALQGERDRLDLELATLLDNARPNTARVEAMQASIGRIDDQIIALRADITSASQRGRSRAEINGLLRSAEEKYQVRLALVQQAVAQLEAARSEANRQVRRVASTSRPILPESPAYPKAFENTGLALLVFAGIYLMLSLSSAVIREQISA